MPLIIREVFAPSTVFESETRAILNRRAFRKQGPAIATTPHHPARTASRRAVGIPVLFVLTILLAGPGLGVFAWYADRVETVTAFGQLIRGLGNIPSPWLLLAFLTGIVLQRPHWGALGAACVLSLAVITYYLAITLSGDRQGIPLQGALTGWLAVALVVGPVFGCAGAVWRNGPALLRPFTVALISGALLGEVAAYFGRDAWQFGQWRLDDTRTLLAIAEIAVACALPLVLLSDARQRVVAYITAGVMGGVALVIMVTLHQVMHDLFNA